jgi:hypothetical protein
MSDAQALEALGALADVPLLHVSDVGGVLGRLTDAAARGSMEEWLRNATTSWCCFPEQEQRRLGVGLKAKLGVRIAELGRLERGMGQLNASDFLRVPDHALLQAVEG